jgi:hypothetical protein
MSLNERETDIYNRLDPGQRHELDSMKMDTEFWLKVKNGGLLLIGAALFIAFIF